MQFHLGGLELHVRFYYNRNAPFLQCLTADIFCKNSFFNQFAEECFT